MNLTAISFKLSLNERADFLRLKEKFKKRAQEEVINSYGQITFANLRIFLNHIGNNIDTTF